VATGSVTFIKSGQALALRSDLVKSPLYIKELEKLQDAVGTFSTPLAMRIIEEDLGVPADELFEFDPPEPIASASIGQVYRARLRESGELVAVKVQRPDAYSSAALDIYILRVLANSWKKYKKLRSDMKAISDEFGKQLFGELNYQQEARNCERFGQLFGQGKVAGIQVPKCYTQYTSRRVLVQEWVEGEKGPWRQDGQRLLMLGLQCSVLQLFESGFFHADPHRGNLLRTPDGSLAYLDFGMMANVTEEKRYGLIGTLLGLQNKDIGLVAENLVTLGFLPDETQLDVVVPALENAIADASGGRGTSRLNFTRLNENVQEISYLLPFRIPPFYATIVRTLTILEGLALNVDPDFRLIRGSYPYVARQILESNSWALQRLLQRFLMTPQGRIDWKRLEQLLQLASAASSNDYATFKKAQKKSDLRRFYNRTLVDQQQQEEDDEDLHISTAVVFQILDFLFSPRGEFLLEALINEMVDVVDDVGLATAGLASIASGGILARPTELPDRERLELVLRLALRLADARPSPAASTSPQSQSPLLPAAFSSFMATTTNGQQSGQQRQSDVRRFAERVVALLRDPRTSSQFSTIIQKGGGVAAEVLRRLFERSTQRAFRQGVEAVLNPTALGLAGNALSILSQTLTPPSPPNTAGSTQQQKQMQQQADGSPRAGDGGRRGGRRRMRRVSDFSSGSVSSFDDGSKGGRRGGRRGMRPR